MRFLATSDWHLGTTAHYLEKEPRARYKEARFDVVEEIGKLAHERDVQFIAVAGDVFESNEVDRAQVNNLFEVLRAAAPIPVFLVPGNHDPLDAASIYDSRDFLRACPDHVHVLRNHRPVEVTPGLQIVGIPWHTRFPASNIFDAAVDSLEPTPSGVRRVIVAHGATEAFGSGEAIETLISPEAATRAVEEGKADFVALGDRHSTTEVAPNVWYSGSPEVTDRVDVDPGNVLMVDLDAAGAADGRPGTSGVAVEKVRVGTWHYRVLDAELDGKESVEALIEELDRLDDKRKTLAYLRLQGALTIAQRAALDDELDRLAGVFAKLEIWERHSHIGVLPDDGDFGSLGLSGFAGAAVTELLEDADAGNLVAADALKLLYRLGMETKQ